MSEPMDSAPRPNWFRDNPWKARGLLLLFLFCMFEGILRLATAAGLYPYEMYPVSFNPVYWDDINPHFGVWHHPHASLRHESSCFDVTYTSNSHGARDRERSLEARGRRRVVVLGDSYAEGYGVPLEHRFSEVLEAQTGVDFLNFGTSGHFGSIQEWQLYEHLARGFEHEAVVLLLLPFNDFSDNRVSDFPASRFRPYLRKVDSGYELYTTVDFENRRRDFRKTSVVIKNSIDNHVYVANFLRWAVRLLKKLRTVEKQQPSTIPYADYAHEDMAVLLHCYEKILKLAGDKPLYVFSIPSAADYQAYAAGRRDFPLLADMARFSDLHPGFHFQDLLPGFHAELQARNLGYADLTLGCDDHWGRRGHQLAAQAIAKFMADTGFVIDPKLNHRDTGATGK